MDNTDGAIDKNTGLFTAKKRGLYRFHFHARATSGTNAYLRIMKGSTILTTMCDKGESQTSMSGSVITRLEVGEEVHLKMLHSQDMIYSDATKYTVFEGFFLAPL